MDRTEKTMRVLGLVVGGIGGIGALLTSLYSMLGFNDHPTTAIVVTGVVMMVAALLCGVFYKIYKRRKWKAHIRETFVLSDVPSTKPKTWKVYRCFNAVFSRLPGYHVFDVDRRCSRWQPVGVHGHIDSLDSSEHWVCVWFDGTSRERRVPASSVLVATTQSPKGHYVGQIAIGWVSPYSTPAPFRNNNYALGSDT